LSAKERARLAEADLRLRLARARKIEIEATEREAKVEERKARARVFQAWARLLGTATFFPWALLVVTVVHWALDPGSGGLELLGHWLLALLPKP
jgi:uncharacterized membrane protein